MAEVSSHHHEYNLAQGSSIPVENVQALAEATDWRNEIPLRYLRHEAEAEPVAKLGEYKIPIIDLSRLINPQYSNEESGKLQFACEEWGFFQLINHGVPKDLMEKMKEDVKEFFKLPLEEKKAYAPLPNNPDGYGQLFVNSEDKKLDWFDMFYINTRPVPTRNMKFWPTNPPTFRDTLDKYSNELKQVAATLLNWMANNLGLVPEVLLSLFNDQPQGLTMNYYPPCPIADKVLGISPHTDATGLTLLLQATDVQGLQIRKDDKWFPIDPLDGAFVVNIGDILEILSNGKYRSIEHRALTNTEKERISIAAFYGPDVGCIVGPIPELIKDGRENYKTTSYMEYMKAYIFAKLNGRSHLKSMRME